MKIPFTIIGFIFSLNAFCQVSKPDTSQQSPSEYLISSTIKIDCLGDSLNNGKIESFSSTGTGFFFTFKIDSNFVPVIVTNYHVLKNCYAGKLTFSETTDFKKPNYGKLVEQEIYNLSQSYIKHPTEDLVIIPIFQIVQDIFNNQHKKILYKPYDESLIPKDSLLNSLSAIEEVLMIGYPKGYWDSKNNLPIVRKGLTATPAYLNFNGENKFLVDIPIFSGSSGSPLLLFNIGSYDGKYGGLVASSRIQLLGIASQSIDYSLNSEITNTKNSDKSVIVTDLPLNIAIIIKSSSLLSFKPILREIIKNQKKLKSQPSNKRKEK